jgi:two-component system phosphate regulon sensor histidine kinase PhoR
MKFRTRLFLIYLMAAVFITVVLSAYFINFEEKRAFQALHEQLLIDAQLIANDFSDPLILQNSKAVAGLVRQLAGQTKLRLTVIAAGGEVLGDSAQDYTRMPNHRDRPEIKLALAGREGFITRYSQTLREYLIYVAYPVIVNHRVIGAVRVAKSQQQLRQMVFRIRLLLSGGILFITALTFCLGWLVVSRITKPIRELQHLATRMSEGDLSGRVRFFGQSELADLGLAFNKMSERLADSFAVIEAEKRKLEVILANLADGILVIDRDLRIILTNPAAQAILGLDAGLSQGRTILEAVLNHHLLDLILKVTQSKAPIESELLLHHPHHKQLQVLLAPLKDETGILTGSIVVLHDLTQLRRLERVRQDFVANVSHELRTPITAIKAMTETLLGGGWQNSEMLLRYLRATDQESDRMANLINDLLALARLDSKTEVTIEPFDPVDLINEVKDRFIAVNLPAPSFAVKLPSESLPKVNANRDQIKQVLINLLDNAFKYTPAGGKITLSVQLLGERLKIAVADTGIGIPSEDLERIFERFYRVDKARSREEGGTGLGLSIVKHIVENYGGRVEVESTLNQGSVFSFTVPVEKGAAEGAG